jgi:hypothetical protein
MVSRRELSSKLCAWFGALLASCAESESGSTAGGPCVDILGEPEGESLVLDGVSCRAGTPEVADSTLIGPEGDMPDAVVESPDTCAPDHVVSPDGTCLGRADCGPGEFRVVVAAETTVAVCVPCPPGTYSAESNSVECLAWSSCTSGSFVVARGSRASDQSCEPCPDGYWSAMSNAEVCEPHGLCPAGTSVAAKGTKIADTVCVACPTGTFAMGTDADVCVLWQACLPGEFLVQTGSSTSDAICAVCPDGTWTGTIDAGACAAWTSCTSGQFVAAAGSSQQDTVCASCPAGTYSDSLNANECIAWTDCGPGEQIRADSPGSASSDRECVPCQDGGWSDQVNGVSCSVWSVCTAGSFVSATGTSKSDRQCESCPPGHFSETSSAEACSLWRTCGPGTAVAFSGSSTANRTCSECPTGTFAVGPNAGACTTMTVCAPGSREVTAGSASSDRSCAACEDGTFTSEVNAPVCAPWRACPIESRQTAEGSATSDRQCEVCEAGASQSPSDPTQCTFGVTVVRASVAHTCAIARRDGRLWCWGALLGTGMMLYRSPAVSADDLKQSGVAIAVRDAESGSQHVFTKPNSGLIPPHVASDSLFGPGWEMVPGGAIEECKRHILTGAVDCFAVSGALESNSLWFSETDPVDEVVFASGGSPTCVILSESRVARCRHFGPDVETKEPWAAEPVRSLAVQQETQCVVLDNTGALVCSGSDGFGIVSGAPSGVDFQIVGLGDGHACAQRTDGTIECWGDDLSGESHVPPIEAIPGSLDVGPYHNCAIGEESGEAFCWGNDASGRVSGAPRKRAFRDCFEISPLAPRRGICCLDDDLAMECMSYDSQYGYGSLAQKPTLPPMLSFSNSGSVACGVTLDGGLQCWSLSPTSPLPASLAEIPTDKDWAEVHVGDTGVLPYACALRASNGTVYCWGHVPPGAPGTAGFEWLSDVTMAELDVEDSVGCVVPALSGIAHCWGGIAFTNGVWPPQEPFSAPVRRLRVRSRHHGDLRVVLTAIDQASGSFLCAAQDKQAQCPAGLPGEAVLDGIVLNGMGCVVRASDGTITCAVADNTDPYAVKALDWNAFLPRYGGFSDIWAIDDFAVACARRASDRSIECFGKVSWNPR